ncbi:hypothetical protein Patl1_11934 [Pistacia atlantica]|uniref:Uncharacterized protein n=1 Tax=Pistacia atlantica TaxID=434234 RepID=A0ACC1A824_9ROSI|nr:hypothetical protein Patl1_11934 [Pistacia atlantica]
MERNLSLCIVLALLVPFSTLSLVNAEVTDISTDKQALLALKARISHDPSNLLANNWHPSSSTGNLSFLAMLVIKNNSFYGSLPEELAHLHRLKYLSFGVIPKEIRILTQLKRLLLNNNKLQGEIPKELGSLSELEILSLANNSLMGTIPSLIFNLSYLISMDFSNNSLSGSLPDNMCQHLPNLEEFYMSYNQLTGPIPHSLGQCRMLDSVMLSNNQFGERIPREIGNLTLIKNLYLSENNLIGEVPCEIGNLHNLECLVLQFNHLIGPVPAAIFNISTIKILSLCGNQLSGILPSTAELPNLEQLPLFGNNFSGSFPSFITNASKLSLLDISNNSFSGFIPSTIDTIDGLQNLQRLYLQNNKLEGFSPNNLCQLSELAELHLGGNKFHGTIPTCLEHGREGKVSRKGDVYSYGIMLMETFTRKKPTDEIFTEDMSLRSWVGESLCSTLMQVLDTNLLRRDDEHFSSKEECVSSILSLAMECTRESPAERMSIKEREMDELAINCP